MGESRFSVAAMAFAAARPAPSSGPRTWVRRFPAHLRDAEPYRKFPELSELAQLEACFHLALEAEEHNGSLIGAADGVSDKILCLHPSVQMLAFHQNTTSLWAALQCEETPPRPFSLERLQNVLVWRQGPTVRFRMLGEDEAAALLAFKRYHSPTSPYFRTWVEAGLVVAAVK